MNIEHIKYQLQDAELSPCLDQEAYNPAGSILNIDLEIILSVTDKMNLRGDNYQNYRMNLNL